MAETWSYGVTTCSERLNTLLPCTLRSLAAAGFGRPRLFIDGEGDAECYGLPVTQRVPAVGAWGNWIMAALELYTREPHALWYAVFQDDLVMCRGVRQYVERCPMRDRAYLNLFTFAHNERRVQGKQKGWHLSDQCGRGAVALVFPHEAMATMITQRHVATKPQSPNGMENVDGAIQTCMVVQARYREYVHQPSLVQHVGSHTSIHTPKHPKGHAGAKTFPGEGIDVGEWK